MTAGARPIIGLLGGMGWLSTRLYYSTLQEMAKSGGANHILINSLPFDSLLQASEERGFDAVGDILSAEAKCLEDAGADMVLLCAVTAHLVHDRVAEAVAVPVPHIGEAMSRHITAHPDRTFGLVGTAPALTGDALSLAGALPDRNLLVPSDAQLKALDLAIRHDIAFGRIGETETATVKAAIADLERQGATDIMLACTELPLLAGDIGTPLPLVDAVSLHCKAALDLAAARA